MNKVEKYIKLRQSLLWLYENKDVDHEKKVCLYRDYISGIRKLAYQGYSEAQVDLAGHYEDIGFWGMPNPFFNAAKRYYWYQKAVANNHSEAHNNLAFLYETGQGCRKNLRKALKLYRKASLLGSSTGKKNYLILKRQLGI